jgi:hypothetical protein
MIASALPRSPGPAGARAVSAAAPSERCHRLGCDLTGARSIVPVQRSQRRDLCPGHRVLVPARARTWLRT